MNKTNDCSESDNLLIATFLSFSIWLTTISWLQNSLANFRAFIEDSAKALTPQLFVHVSPQIVKAGAAFFWTL